MKKQAAVVVELYPNDEDTFEPAKVFVGNGALASAREWVLEAQAETKSEYEIYEMSDGLEFTELDEDSCSASLSDKEHLAHGPVRPKAV